MNHIIIAGRLGADPEVRFTSSGTKVTTLRLATNSRRAGKEETIWYRVTIWGEQFDKLVAHLKKGSAIMVTGDFAKPEIYTDKEGQAKVSLNVTASSIQFSPFGRSDKDAQTSAQPGSSFEAPKAFESATAGQAAPQSTGFSDEEIPF